MLKGIALLLKLPQAYNRKLLNLDGLQESPISLADEGKCYASYPFGLSTHKKTWSQDAAMLAYVWEWSTI